MNLGKIIKIKKPKNNGKITVFYPAPEIFIKKPKIKTPVQK